MTNFIRFTLLLSLFFSLAACQPAAPMPTDTAAPLPTYTPTVAPPATAGHDATAPTSPYQYGSTQPTMPAADAPSMQNAAGFGSQFAIADHLVILLTGMPAAPEGQAYQGWLTSADGALLGVGKIAPAADGTLSFEWTSPTGENLLSRFTGFQITLEPADGSDTPTGSVVYSGAMTEEQAASVRLLFVTNTGEPVTPLNTPLIPGLLTQLDIAIQHIQNAQNAEAIGAAQEMRVHLEHIINILEGADGERFKDYNGDGAAQNPGDGFGVKGYARQSAAVLSTPDLATPIISGVDALQDQALAIIELDDLAQAADLLATLHTSAETLRDGPVTALYHQADKMAWFPVLPIP
jgi:hypothetical protein